MSFLSPGKPAVASQSPASVAPIPAAIQQAPPNPAQPTQPPAPTNTTVAAQPAPAAPPAFGTTTTPTSKAKTGSSAPSFLSSAALSPTNTAQKTLIGQ